MKRRYRDAEQAYALGRWEQRLKEQLCDSFEILKALYFQRHKVENLFARLRDWRRMATRYDRRAHTFF
jgi:transposase